METVTNLHCSLDNFVYPKPKYSQWWTPRNIDWLWDTKPHSFLFMIVQRRQRKCLSSKMCTKKKLFSMPGK